MDYLRKTGCSANYAGKEISVETTDSPEVVLMILNWKEKPNAALAKLPDNVRKAFQMSCLREYDLQNK